MRAPPASRGERPGAVEGGGVEIERVARAGLRGAAHDEGERGRARIARDERKIDARREAPRPALRRWRRPRSAKRRRPGRRAAPSPMATLYGEPPSTAS